ncbi:outer membrane protein assembly factor BamA [Niveibacterium sp. 24ML]|uniref:outer membrane protein assembly factor BamA n=1 Tax=Niveibacterium sp. 24ML TaxID=2985512 RepID=UPI002270C19C|nr:outer membrane protein assembly factor BamA [Niveibacterium sp. 24ML]MCX9156563.1 outer membrane protein assembly factor BamA [Niveibacterium sp. 24ML]
MRHKLISGLILSLFAATAAHAFDPFVVKDIRVEGLQRTEAGTVFNYLPIKVGERVTEERAAQAIRALYATGFFKDVRLEVDGSVLVVVIDERPAIGSIEFEGNSAFDSENLRKGLRDAGIAESRILDRALLERAEQELKRQYLNRSYYGATITTEIVPLERNRVALKFKISEGEIAAIKQVSITGNKVFSESELKNQISATPKYWFPPVNWLSKGHEYSKPKLQGDLENIRSYYLNRGYLDFAIDSSQVSITPDKQDVYIAISVAEGEQYKVAGVKLAGDLIVSDAEARSLVKLRPGDVFARDQLTETTRLISERLSNEGYAFANVNAAPELDKAKREVTFTIFVDPGKRVYIRRVNISGNTRTRDEVIRRELRQFENAWYDGTKIKRSKARLDRSGFYDETNVDTQPVPGTSDQVDLNVTVKERATGNFLLGAGYSTTEKLVLQGSLSQNNLFGSGNALSLNLNTGKSNRTFVLSYTNPYFTPEGVSLGYNLYHRKYNPSATTNVAYYRTESTGLGMTVGYPIAEDDTVFFGASFDSTRTFVDGTTDVQYIDFVNQFGELTNTFLLTASWAKDSRDSYLTPLSGFYQRLQTEVAIPPAEQQYYRINYQAQYFIPLFFKDSTLQFRGNVSYASGYGDLPVPFYKNYYAGGIGSVRAYDDNSLGPRSSNGNALGGTQLLTFGAEYFFPLPVANAGKGFRLSLYADGGQVWGADQKVDPEDLRYSAGVGLAWVSPVGPLKFSFGQPLNKKEGDRTQRFQFQMGNIF